MRINRPIERFPRKAGLPPTIFGRLAARDPRLVRDMRIGREIRPEWDQNYGISSSTIPDTTTRQKEKQHKKQDQLAPIGKQFTAIISERYLCCNPSTSLAWHNLRRPSV